MGSRKHVNIGAMRIMSRWSDHWLPSTGYWWIGVAVLCLLILAVYNNALTMSMISTHQLRFLQPTNENTQKNPITIYMHVIENTKFINIDKYLPHVEELMFNFPKLNFNFVVLINDTNGMEYRFKTEEDNINAINKVMIADEVRDNINGLNIIYLSLSKYLDESPIKKYWREMPSKFIPFLVRAFSIWDKGGIAFNPNILLPGILKYEYMNPLRNVIQKYGEIPGTNHKNGRKIVFNIHKKEVNNIQDIIHELENEENINYKEINPYEAESKTMKRYSKKVTASKVKDAAEIIKEKKTKFKQIFDDLNTKYAVIINPNDTENETVKNKSNRGITRPIEIPTFIKMAAYPEPNKAENNNNVNLSLDLNGNILATDTPCHAFLGMLFSNTHNYTELSLTDFIIKELTIFCGGLLSTCKGINVIFI